MGSVKEEHVRRHSSLRNDVEIVYLAIMRKKEIANVMKDFDIED